MKKIVISLAGLLAAAAFAPQASAVPSFARQTGMACDACHFNSYPILTAFGKSFKTGGYTMMGSETLVEGEHGLSIPSTLNMSVYLQHRTKKTTGGPKDAVGAASTNSGALGRIDFPDEFALFAAGRVSEGMGSLTEINIGSGAAGMAGTKLAIVNEIGDMKLLVVPFTVGGLGPQYGFDLFATGSTANGRVMENKDYSAAIYLGTDTSASGAAVVVASDLFHVSFTPWVAGFAASNSGVTATELGGQYVRAAFTPTLGGFETGFGVQYFAGNALKGVDAASAGTTPAVVANNVNKAMIIDAQAQGEVAGMPIGIYASYGSAAKSTATEVNMYNGSATTDKTKLGMLVDLGVVPHVFNVQLGYSTAKTGAQIGTADETDNAVIVGVRYKLRQNFKLAAAYSMYSGTAQDAGGSFDHAAGFQGGKSLLQVTMSTGF